MNDSHWYNQYITNDMMLLETEAFMKENVVSSSK